MPERRTWNPEEDKILKYLRQDLRISKWSIIAKKMSDEYNLPDRTGKQCRERYHNHLDASILRTEWSAEQEQYLYKLHDEIGNKWAIIAQKLQGRTDNCVKNHFYSKMRKAIRKLNKIIYQHFRKELKEIKINVLNKIVEATDERFQTSPTIDQQISDKCCRLKNMLLIYSNDGCQLETDIEKLGMLAKEIHDFSSKYRRKVKKTRRASLSGQEIAMKLPRFSGNATKPMSDCSDDPSEEEDQQYSDNQNFQEKEKNKLESIKQVDDMKSSTNSVLGKDIKMIPIFNPTRMMAPTLALSTLSLTDSQNHGFMEKSMRIDESFNMGMINRASLIKPPPLNVSKIKRKEVEQGPRIEKFLQTKGIVENEVESPLQNNGGSSMKMQMMCSISMVDSSRSMGQSMNRSMEEQQKPVTLDFLSESIEKMRITGDLMVNSMDLDEQKLFPSV